MVKFLFAPIERLSPVPVYEQPPQIRNAQFHLSCYFWITDHPLRTSSAISALPDNERRHLLSLGAAVPLSNASYHRIFIPYFCVIGGTIPFIRTYSTSCP